MESLLRLMGRHVLYVSFFGEVDHSKDYFTILWLLKVDIICNDRIDQVVVSITLSHKLGIENPSKHFSDFDKFFDVKFWCGMNNCSESIVHILWSSKFLNLSESAVDLVAHCRNNVIDGNHALFIDQSFGPDLCINFVSSFKMSADVILFLCNSSQLFTSVNVDA